MRTLFADQQSLHLLDKAQCAFCIEELWMIMVQLSMRSVKSCAPLQGSSMPCAMASGSCVALCAYKSTPPTRRCAKSLPSCVAWRLQDIPDAKESGLSHLCEFIEDCEFTYLSAQILHVLGARTGRCLAQHE